MSKSNFTPFLRQCFVTAAVCCNIVGHGCVFGYPAVLLPQLHDPSNTVLPITKDADSWIASLLCISLLAGNFITTPIMGKCGRKIAHYAVTLPVIVGWFTIILASNVKILLIGRILQGLSVGMLMPLRSALIGEYTSPSNRGAFLTTISLAQCFGIFFVHLIGSLFTWQYTALICVSFSFVSLMMTIYSPESPSYLAAKGNYDECRKAFRWLRGDGEEDELDEMIQARLLIEKKKIGEERKDNQFNKVFVTIKKKEFYKPILLMIHIYCMVQFSGGTTMASYSTKIIRLLMGPGVNVHFWMVALDTQRIISNAAAIYVINKTKRRTMMFSTGALCVISHLAIAVYFYAKTKNFLPYDALWIPVVLINMHFFTVATGTVPLSSIIPGEVFPLEYRSIGGSVSFISGAVFMFFTLKTFPGLIESIGLDGTYTLYAVILTYTFIVIWFLLPETKGRTLQQIEDEFRGRPLPPEEIEAGQSLQADPLEAYKRKISMRRCSSPVLA